MSGMATTPSDPVGPADPAASELPPPAPRRTRARSSSGSRGPPALPVARLGAARAPAHVDRGGAWCVVGAGPHGMSALKALLQNGIEADGFERERDVGGNWNFGAENSRVYESTHLISSKPFTQFPDFPMPDAYPDYPSHRQVKEYFGRYTDHFGLRRAIRFSTDVVRAEPVDEGRAWDVTVRDRVSAAETTYRYAGLVVGNGHNWNPKVPDYAGRAEFRGEVLHSADYKGPEVLRGKRVLVVGAGNTGCDVAVEAAQNAAHTWHSTRTRLLLQPEVHDGSAQRPGRGQPAGTASAARRTPCAVRGVALDRGRRPDQVRAQEARPQVLRDPPDRQPAARLLRRAGRHHAEGRHRAVRRRRRRLHRRLARGRRPRRLLHRLPRAVPVPRGAVAELAGRPPGSCSCRCSRRPTTTSSSPG